MSSGCIVDRRGGEADGAGEFTLNLAKELLTLLYNSMLVNSKIRKSGENHRTLQFWSFHLQVEEQCIPPRFASPFWRHG